MDDVRVIKKTEKIHEVDFLVLGQPTPLSFNLRIDRGDAVVEKNDRYEVTCKSADPVEFHTIYKRNLLARSDRIRVIEVPEPGESALDKHLESLRQEQTRSAVPAA